MKLKRIVAALTIAAMVVGATFTAQAKQTKQSVADNMTKTLSSTGFKARTRLDTSTDRYFIMFYDDSAMAIIEAMKIVLNPSDYSTSLYIQAEDVITSTEDMVKNASTVFSVAGYSTEPVLCFSNNGSWNSLAGIYYTPSLGWRTF